MTKTSGQIERERRRKKNEIVISDSSKCYYCKSTGLEEVDKFCPNCRFPQRGSQVDMHKFLHSIQTKKNLIDENRNAIRMARNTLYILAAINLLFGVIYGLVDSYNLPVLITSIIGSLIYLSLGIWSKHKPFAAILSGFFLYVVFIVIGGISNPHTLYQGILWKGLIIGMLIRGYKGVKDSEKLIEELKTIKTTKDLEDSNEV